MTDLWTQGSLIPLTITSLSGEGEGLGHYEGRVVFVPNTVPGDVLQARLLHVKPAYAQGNLQTLVQPSPHRIRAACIVADKCGGCQWQQVDYETQLQAKQQRVQEALERLCWKLLDHPDPLPTAEPILGADPILHYRNKVTYPIGQESGTLKMGYYITGSHKLINLNQCPVQDERLDEFLREIKLDLQKTGWTVYNEHRHQGSLKHLGLRIGRRTGEVLLTLVVKDPSLPGLQEWAEQWMERFPNLVGVSLNINPAKTNAIFGAQTRSIVGRSALREEFAGFTLWIDSTSFFQVYTEQAETFFLWILSQLQLTGQETVVDAYCGIGTLTLLLAKVARQVIGIESLPEAVRQAEHNARFNQLTNVSFLSGTVEQWLRTLPTADLVVLDPPRKGCDQAVLDTLLRHLPHQIVYISCHPATLARDLRILLQSNHYRLTRWRAADFFPQTAHVETVAFLERIGEGGSGVIEVDAN